MACVASFALGACATFDPDAATVNGTRIQRDQFEDDLEALRDNEQFVAALGTPVAGQLQNSVSTAFAASELTNQIRSTLVGDELERRGLSVDPSVQEAGAALVPATYLSGVANPDEVLATLPEDYRRQLESWSAESLALALDVTGVGAAEVPQYLADARSSFEGLCLRGVPTQSDADGQAALAALEGGAPVADVVTQYGIPQTVGPNGELSQPCYDPEQIGPLAVEFEGSEPGDVVGPIEDGGFFVVFQVVEPDPTTVFGALLTNPAYQQWQQEALSAADISVDPRYGSWDSTQAAVLPPGSAPL